VDVPIVDVVPVIFKTVDIRIAVIKIVDTSSTPVDVWVVMVIVLCPSFYTVPL
jgi:hypothetical protein